MLSWRGRLELKCWNLLTMVEELRFDAELMYLVEQCMQAWSLLKSQAASCCCLRQMNLHLTRCMPRQTCEADLICLNLVVVAFVRSEMLAQMLQKETR